MVEFGHSTANLDKTRVRTFRRARLILGTFPLRTNSFFFIRKQRPDTSRLEECCRDEHKDVAVQNWKNKFADYVKTVPYSKVTVIFYLKKYDPGQLNFNMTYKLMKCPSVQVKVNADEDPTEEVVCIVLIFYTGADQVKRVRNKRLRETNRQFITDWAI
jgi:hypothetical protein